MECAIFGCPAEWEEWLPPGICRATYEGDLTERKWSLLAVTSGGCQLLSGKPIDCQTLLAPGDCAPACLEQIRADCVITYGLSPRDSLTLSSLESPILCLQRALRRPDGIVLEPQEIPIPELSLPAVEALPLLGLWLLRMPLTEGKSSGDMSQKKGEQSCGSLL